METKTPEPHAAPPPAHATRTQVGSHSTWLSFFIQASCMPGHHVTDAHTCIGKPPGLHLQYVPCWLARTPDIVRPGRQILELDNATSRINESGRQSERRVTHPQAAGSLEWQRGSTIPC